MGIRRLISLDIVDTDVFLDLPVSTQLLYFHLNTRTDDDGFISSPRKIMRMIGSQKNDIDLLVSQKFIIPFKSGVCVIKHWRINNSIRKDRYTETKYMKEKSTLLIRENGAYTLTDDYRSVQVPNGYFIIENLFENSWLTTGRPMVALSKVKLSKVKLSKVKEDTPAEIASSFFSKEKYYKEIINLLSEKIKNEILLPEVDKFILYWTEPNKSGTKVRWEMQKTFDVKRRLKTWFENKQQWKLEKKSNKRKIII